ncbi:putative repeat protein (TIGR01451 family) [Spirosoma lacussanchae]|uniref:sialate O-acetylesterase n=1 Tax=Spirosoma lacussanchae TaxID=1884249 RepID=UPI0011090E4D|nr:sialate O-acetylesterase [Spirosoma lacussanchae]
MCTRLLWLLLLFSSPVLSIAQLQINHPMARLVIQRGNDGNGRLYVSGQLRGQADRIEARLTPVVAGQGTETAWQTVQTNPVNGVFLGYITGTGGWYTLSVRAIISNTVSSEATVQPVGIGEVFVTAGQSNSRGLGIGDNDLGTATDRVNAIDSINHYYPPSPQPLLSSGDPMPVPVYKALTAGRRIFPMAESSWGWGELGDYIVNRYNVPVAFYVAGWDGSTIDNWDKTARGIPTCNAYFCNENWQNLQPYTNLKNVLQYYASMAGIRAVLWHQGEAEGDVARDQIPQYATILRSVIEKARQDYGGRSMAWVVARASYNGQVTTPAVVSQQDAVIATPGFNVFQGPLNDTIQNRNGGDTDVHFANALRPSVHPRYYLNPNSIPVNMGLSRFARNWNNSLSNSFFQNAQPITPAVFAATGTLAEYVLPADSLRVTFVTSGTFGSGNQWQVQLLDSLGRYKATLGSGPASPVRVKLPAGYQSGRYRVRVVSSSPVIPAVPSNLFRITSQIPAADLSLSASVDQRTPGLNEPVTLSLTVQNQGPAAATDILVRNRLPDNLAVVSVPASMTSSGNVVSGTIDRLEAGTQSTLTFTVKPTATGFYRNSAEIAQVAQPDPDSQPNSGTGDGQDDATGLDFRTAQTGAGVFVSPNPNQVPLPAVQSNQPPPDPARADMSLRIAVSNRAPRLNEVISFSITITNTGGLSATSVNLTAYLPNNLSFVPGEDLAPGGGGLSGGLSSLAAGTSHVFRFSARAISVGRGICSAQLTASGQADPDSTPNNGTANGEDDTAQVDIRVQ